MDTHAVTVPYPHFEVNCKVYPGTRGGEGRAFAELVERADSSNCSPQSGQQSHVTSISSSGSGADRHSGS